MEEITITGPDGSEFNFPVGTSPETIKRAMQSHYAVSSEKQPGMVEDVAKTIPPGLARGAAGLVGLPSLIKSGVDAGVDHTLGRAVNYVFGDGSLSPYKPPQDAPKSRLTGVPLPTSEDVVSKIESVTGPLYKPKTVAGEYVNTIAEFAPGMVLGGGSLFRRAMQTAVPAITSETAGQAARHSNLKDYEGVARAVGALGGGLGVAVAQRPSATERVMSRSLSGVSPAEVRQAMDVLDDAARQGVTLTWDEAINQVTKGAATRLSGVRRFAEQSPGGADVLGPAMAQRPAQVERAGSAAIDPLVSQRMDPVRAGLAAQKAAQGVIDDTVERINQYTRPYYDAAKSQRIDPVIARQLASDDLYMQTLREVRGDPSLNRTISNLTDDSVGVIDLVQRRLREKATNAAMPGQASTSNLSAANFGSARREAIDAAEAATGGTQGSYATARNQQAAFRDGVLEPMKTGPVGQVSRTSDIENQGRSLLPTKPQPGNEAIVSQAVSRLVSRDPVAAENLLYSYVRSTFDEATQNLAGGAAQAGGAKFGAIVRGNSQQAKDLEAAVRALPNGGVRWNGLQRFLDTVEATGYRPNQNSATSFNETYKQMLQQPGATQAAIEGMKTGGTSLIKRIMQWRDMRDVEKKSEQIARLLLDPASGKILERLAKLPNGSAQAPILALRLTYMGKAASDAPPKSP